MTISEILKSYQDQIIDQVSELESRLYVEAVESSKSPAGSIRYLKKLKSELPDTYAGTIEQVVQYALSAKAIDDVISKVYDEALKQEWRQNDD
ncbi:hypothetical protein lacNasYZ03_11340 [Lactobacillus nasalidis]|uniref:Uncharacterized protein n=1 Tax=Lactobacillus nasalidis TaxID=2797258 RepID=A0ABQ3WB66_9LACO|nr:hypothetical protein [Lactobacillus nasalidis]GHV97857.1 hypothetical protein lacNasYZ01_10390 [Lactobacillus nasalidis]GHW00087.1 hypothetical protein lacNasYZ02_15160 [Lactobacillus nasalidis]GHW01447.1 hypothetical protein lacNasYZ03_11340 [Lactobacillus nasalidis]